MSHTISSDIAELIKNEMVLGGYASEEAVLRDALSLLADRRATMADIQQGMEDIQAGKGRPLQDVDADIRRDFCIPSSR